jgi:hypothetical protein
VPAIGHPDGAAPEQGPEVGRDRRGDGGELVPGAGQREQERAGARRADRGGDGPAMA